MQETHNARILPKWRVTVNGCSILRSGNTRKAVVEDARMDLRSLKETGTLQRRVDGCNEYEDQEEISG